MVENLGRKLTLIVTLLVVSLGLLIVPSDPFRLGLDLQGGTRLVYSFDFDHPDSNVLMTVAGDTVRIAGVEPTGGWT